MGIYGTGIEIIDLDGNVEKTIIPGPGGYGLRDGYINDLLEDSRGAVWVATARGLHRWNDGRERFDAFTNIPEDTTSLCHNIVITLMEDSGGRIWAGTNAGLSRFNPETGRFRSWFIPDTFNAEQTIFSLLELSDDTLLVGTAGNGIFMLNPGSGKWSRPASLPELTQGVVYSILADRNGNIWFSTNKGIYRFNPAMRHISGFDSRDGLQSNEFNLGAGLSIRRNLLFFGGMNGFSYFWPDSISLDTAPPRLIVSEFRILDETVALELRNGDTITLENDQNFFSIELAAIDFARPDKCKYRYFLEGVDKSMVETDVFGRKTVYKNLSPGSHRFVAYASNGDGFWTKKPLVLNFHIRPAWYQTWWFKIAVIVLVFGSLALIVFSQYLRLKRRHQLEKRVLEVEKAKMEFEKQSLRLRMNPHFLFNSLNSIQSFILTHKTEEAVYYLGKFSRLMRLILRYSGQSWITLEEEVEALKYYLELEQLRFEHQFDFSIDINETLDTDFVEIPPMLIQPYAENAVIHGLRYKTGKGNLAITFKAEGDDLICEITDNGIGRKKAAELAEQKGEVRDHAGMKITGERLRTIRESTGHKNTGVHVDDLYDEYGEPAGTRVKLILPFRYQKL
ncbi:MAG: hypothetical protein Kow00127_13610 [Bacteroidales bacterium]